MYKIPPIRVAYIKPRNLKFLRHLRLYTETGGTLYLKKPVFDFSLL